MSASWGETRRLFTQRVIDAVINKDAGDLCRIVEIYRINGFNYSDTWRAINNIKPIELADFDELLREGDK